MGFRVRGKFRGEEAVLRLVKVAAGFPHPAERKRGFAGMSA